MTNIILVNFNNWKDTIVCLESLKFNVFVDHRVVIVDNASSDGSSEQIINWFNNQTSFKEFYPKSENYQCENKQINFCISQADNLEHIDYNASHFLIVSDKNNGFSYGNNLGIHLVNKFKSDDYFWFLNNDTFIDKNTINNLISYFNSDNFGLIGSKLINYEYPHAIQAYYGHFNSRRGKNTIIKDLNSKLPISYPIGASLFTNKKILEEVGIFDEKYFLYYEELDFSFRVKKAGYKIGYALNSIVYHKQGASTNSVQVKRKKNLFVIMISYQSLIKFYSKNIPNQMLGAYLYLIRQCISSLLKFEIKRSILAFKTIFYKP